MNLGESLNRIAVIADGVFWFETDWDAEATELVERMAASLDCRYEIWCHFELGSALIRRSLPRVAWIRRAA